MMRKAGAACALVLAVIHCCALCGGTASCSEFWGSSVLRPPLHEHDAANFHLWTRVRARPALQLRGGATGRTGEGWPGSAASAMEWGEESNYDVAGRGSETDEGLEKNGNWPNAMAAMVLECGGATEGHVSL